MLASQLLRLLFKLIDLASGALVQAGEGPDTIPFRSRMLNGTSTLLKDKIHSAMKDSPFYGRTSW